MTPRKLEHAALFLVLFGVMLFLPPLALVFNFPARIFGLPYEVVYLFTAWLALIVGAAWLSRHLPRDEDGDG